MNIGFRKEWGQNFLTSRDWAKKLVGAANITRDDIVLEIGAGAGMVTQYLVEVARKVIAIEIDKRFVKLMKNRFKEEIDNEKLEIKNEDVLKIEVEGCWLKARNYKLVGSLPYNISKKIIKKFLEEERFPSSITVIIQKEVAEDYVAKVPKATFLSNYVKIFGEAEFVDVVPKEVFNPMPKVDGAIIQLKIKSEKLKVKDWDKFTKFLKSAFLNPRKKLINNLSGIYKLEKSKLAKIFGSIGIEVNARAANLQFEEWLGLYDKLK
jgi:16S rRNA (adenine1518-N6/adenine1519-N6)-dimethyltransferase